MNHDYAHCADFADSCPRKCFRAKLVRDLHNNPNVTGIWISWMHLKGTAECVREDGNHHEG